MDTRPTALPTDRPTGAPIDRSPDTETARPTDRPTTRSAGSWLTFQQVGELLGLSAEAARSRARRAGWRTQPGNDGRTLVLVPDDIAAEPRPPGRPGDRPGGRPPEQTAEIVRLTEALAMALGQLGEALQRADAADADRRAAGVMIDGFAARVDRAEEAMAAERARAERAEAGRDGERARADTLRDRLDVLQAEIAAAQADARAAQDAAETLRQADAARRGRGVLARLRDAWRGE
jgi:hypothetical protein